MCQFSLSASKQLLRGVALDEKGGAMGRTFALGHYTNSVKNKLKCAKFWFGRQISLKYHCTFLEFKG